MIKKPFDSVCFGNYFVLLKRSRDQNRTEINSGHEVIFHIKEWNWAGLLLLTASRFLLDSLNEKCPQLLKHRLQFHHLIWNHGLTTVPAFTVDFYRYSLYIKDETSRLFFLVMVFLLWLQQLHSTGQTKQFHHIYLHHFTQCGINENETAH